VLPIASFAGDIATAVGIVAGMIAIGGFVGHVPSVPGRAPAREIQQATVSGGMAAAVAILGMVAVGVRGELLSFGAFVPLVLMAYSSTRVIMHFGPYGDPPRR
jgi:hypothetical protein